MKIVVLDGYAANPGDLSWEGMKVLGECRGIRTCSRCRSNSD